MINLGFFFTEHKDDILAAAQWLETRLKKAGLEVGAFTYPAVTVTTDLKVTNNNVVKR